MAKQKKPTKIIRQGERIEVTMEKAVAGLKKGAKVLLHPLTAESFKKKGFIK